MTEEKFTALCDYARELGDMPMDELRVLYADERNVNKARQECKGISRGQMIATLIRNVYQQDVQ